MAATMTEAEPKPRLNALNDRRTSVRISLADRTYSAVVKKLRWALPFAALGIVAILMIWPKIETEISQKRFAPTKVDRATLEKAARENRLMNAKFSSLDAKGRPFMIEALEALQDTTNPDHITLKMPYGMLELSNNTKLTASARSGLYLQKDQMLTLTQDVVMERSDGTVMNTATMLVNLMTNDASTTDPVSIKGPQGTLDARNMAMSGGGAITIFGGPIKLVLNSRNSISLKEGTQ